MASMKRSVIRWLLLFLAAGFVPCRAEWHVLSRESVDAPKGLDFQRIEMGGTYGERAEIHAVQFSPKTHAFAVMDNPAGVYDTQSAALKRGASAAVNGGYFQPDRTPLGLVVRQGAEIHPMEKARLLSGFVAVRGGRMALLRVAEFHMSPSVTEALQAGPFLIDGGKAVSGLEATRRAERTVVFSENDGRFGVLILKSATLSEAAAILTTSQLFESGKITRALNLDGGSSTALWVRGDPAFYAREWKQVRTYLAVVPRPAS